jgi:hypothetical protein
MPSNNALQINNLKIIPILLRSMTSGKRSYNLQLISQVRISNNIYSGSPGKTLMLLKKASKPQRSGFKRKKLTVLGTFKEI